MIQKILNNDFVLEVQAMKDKGYTYRQISEILKIKFSLKSCSEKTVQRAYEKKNEKNRTESGQKQDRIWTVSKERIKKGLCDLKN